MSLRETLVKPASINFARKCAINILTDDVTKAFITESNLKEFMDAYADFIEKVSGNNDVLGTREYDIRCYSSRDGSIIYNYSLHSRHV